MRRLVLKEDKAIGWDEFCDRPPLMPGEDWIGWNGDHKFLLHGLADHQCHIEVWPEEGRLGKHFSLARPVDQARIRPALDNLGHDVESAKWLPVKPYEVIHQTWFIYGTSDRRFVRIGHARYPHNRLKALQAGCPLRLRVWMHLNRADADIFPHMHWKARVRPDAEWYHLTDEIGQWLMEHNDGIDPFKD